VGIHRCASHVSIVYKADIRNQVRRAVMNARFAWLAAAPLRLRVDRGAPDGHIFYASARP